MVPTLGEKKGLLGQNEQALGSAAQVQEAQSYRARLPGRDVALVVGRATTVSRCWPRGAISI